MSCYSGPKILNNGLILALDSSNVKSYPGSGAVMYDVSGANTSVSGTVSTTATSPGTVIDYSTSGLILCTFPAIGKGAFTLSYTGRGTGIPSANYRPIFRFYDTNAVQYFMGDSRTTASPFILHYVKDFSLAVWSTYNVTTNAEYLQYTWNQYTLVVDGLNFSCYKNGELQGTTSITVSLTGYTNISQLELNGAGPHAFQLQSLQLYDRVLSATEIKQNFTSIRSRYNI